MLVSKIEKVAVEGTGTLRTQIALQAVKGEGNSSTIVIYEKYADKDAFKLHSANLMTSMGRLFALLDPQMHIKTCTEIL